MGQPQDSGRGPARAANGRRYGAWNVAWNVARNVAWNVAWNVGWDIALRCIVWPCGALRCVLVCCD